jgi:hypothetical protein
MLMSIGCCGEPDGKFMLMVIGCDDECCCGYSEYGEYRYCGYWEYCEDCEYGYSGYCNGGGEYGSCEYEDGKYGSCEYVWVWTGEP